MIKKIFISFLILLVLYACGSKPAQEEEIIEVKDYTNYQWNCLYEVNGLKHYEDTTYTCKVGIDLSEFQDDIDWASLKEYHLDFIYLRGARRGATDGIIYDDKEFENHYKAIQDLNVEIGVYFFSQATTPEEATEEAAYLLSKIKNKNITLPVVYDIENTYKENNRIENLDKKTITENAIAFCEEIKKNNYEAMIYTGKKWAKNCFDMEQLQDYPIWLAYYGDDYGTFDYPVSIWQYTNAGVLNGINGDVDLDLMFIKKEVSEDDLQG